VNPYLLAKRSSASIFGSPDYARLEGEIIQTRIEIEQQAASATGGDWLKAAKTYLGEAETYLKQWNIQEGWNALKCAQRKVLLNLDDPDRARRAAIALRQESTKLDSSWRVRAIRDLICDPEGELLDELKKLGGGALGADLHNRVIDAIALRDDYSNTTYHKIMLRRRSLFQLFLVLGVGIVATLTLSYFRSLPKPFDELKVVAAVILFGVFGATLSVAQGLLAADLKSKIPAQQIGAFIVWMRPGVGAAAALIALALAHANKSLGLFPHLVPEFDVIAVIAFAAGYSERFIVGAIEKFIGDKGHNDKGHKE